jgi:hypothetical protein
MDLERLKTKLVAAARNNAPSDKVPYAFEKRIMAGLRSRVAEDPWTVWGQWLWRSAMSFAAVAIACGVWSLRRLEFWFGGFFRDGRFR